MIFYFINLFIPSFIASFLSSLLSSFLHTFLLLSSLLPFFLIPSFLPSLLPSFIPSFLLLCLPSPSCLTVNFFHIPAFYSMVQTRCRCQVQQQTNLLYHTKQRYLFYNTVLYNNLFHWTLLCDLCGSISQFFQSQKQEIFVDLLEGLTVLIGSNVNTWFTLIQLINSIN